MKKYLLTLFLIFGITVNIYCSPDNSMSITPSATDGTTITASDENTRNNEISTKFNAHDHNDIDQTANTLAVGDATAGNKTITANNADINKPFIRYDDTNNIWVVSVDGSNVSAIITRSGSSTNYRILPQTPVAGDILYANASDWISLAKGTAGQVLEMNAGATAPEWGTDDIGAAYTDSRFKMVQATRDLTAASGSQAITGAGFAPKGVIIIGGVDGGLPNTWGVAESGGTLWSMGICQDFKMAVVNGSVIIAVQGNYLTPYQNATISSWNSDGITLSWTKVGAPTGTLTFACYFLR